MSRSPRRALPVGLLGLCALPGAAAWGVALVGLGVLRTLPPSIVVCVAGLGVVLPLALGWMVSRNGVGGALGLLLGSLLGLTMLPAYFPGERADALAAGVSVLALPFGVDPDALPVDALDAAWPRPLVGRVVPPGAEPEAVEALPPPVVQPEVASAAAPELVDDAVVLPYEGTGRSLTVPVSVESGEEEAEVWMLFDTGATLTTLDQATLERLGLTVPEDAPQLTVRTANGERVSSVVLVDRLWIGGFAVEGVSISVCDECAGDNAVGLLGLNVSGRFLVTVDQARRELVLQPRDAARDRSVDISPWLELWAQASRWPDGRVEVEVEVDNHSTREVRDVKVDISCVKTWVAELAVVPPGGSASTIVSLPRGTDCETYSVALGGARW